MMQMVDFKQMKRDKPFEQLSFLRQDYIKTSGSKKLRMFYIWLNRGVIGIALYRLERMMFLLLGKFWKIFRILFIPFLYPLYAYSNCEISYAAKIGPGIKILHLSMGVVISGFVTIGLNMTLTGGNVIGGKPAVRSNKEFKIGDNLNMGANSVILGPISLGNNVIVGANALVNKSFQMDTVLVGVPAQPISYGINNV